KQTSKFIFVEVKERTSIIRRNSRLERIAAKAWREMKPIRMRGEYDSSQPWEFVAEEAEIIDGNNGELSLYDATEQDGQLSLATGGGELSIAEE
ncbi:hypothetical protein HYS49_02995, partial [Candidatus Woesearchaeota archaeon]|nr:hypothetical protein [Candidatus Woesearchaeota archaeon]